MNEDDRVERAHAAAAAREARRKRNERIEARRQANIARKKASDEKWRRRQ